MIGQKGQIPILVLKEGTERERGKTAQINNIAAAKAVADAIKSTLGPKCLDKMLVDSMGDILTTNDGAGILKKMDVEHPSAKMLVEVAKAQDTECGDGTTTAVVLAGELLKKAEQLIDQKIHPTIITNGYRLACAKANEALEKISKKIDINDRETLRKIGMTCMGSKAPRALPHLVEIVVSAIEKVKEEKEGKTIVPRGNIHIVKKHGASTEDVELVDGMVMTNEPVCSDMPRVVKNAKIALLSSALQIKKTEVDAKIKIKSPEQIKKFLDEEERVLIEKVKKVKDLGVNVLFCGKEIADLVGYELSKEGIYAVKQVADKDMEKLAKATGGRIVGNVNELEENDLGKADIVENKKIVGTNMTIVSGCKSAKAVTIFVRGGTEHAVDAVERIIEKGIKALSAAIEDGKIVVGGGAAPMEIATDLKKYATTISGREQLAIESFSSAIEVIPRTLAENGGLNSVDILIKLRKEHKDGNKGAGIDLDTGNIVKLDDKIIEPTKILRQAINTATEASTMILRIDDIISAHRPKKEKEKG
ncbi:MAG: thermosome subunit beta [Candidatus Thermoplasmatota archaeon]